MTSATNMKIHEFLTDESKWCQGASSKDRNGIPTDQFTRGLARSYCLRELINRHYSDSEENLRVTRLVQAEISNFITYWNDERERTFQDVKNLTLKLNI